MRIAATTISISISISISIATPRQCDRYQPLHLGIFCSGCCVVLRIILNINGAAASSSAQELVSCGAL
jgi:hypothetical protein